MNKILQGRSKTGLNDWKSPEYITREKPVVFTTRSILIKHKVKASYKKNRRKKKKHMHGWNVHNKMHLEKMNNLVFACYRASNKTLTIFFICVCSIAQIVLL